VGAGHLVLAGLGYVVGEVEWIVVMESIGVSRGELIGLVLARKGPVFFFSVDGSHVLNCDAGLGFGRHSHASSF
jgi:hypothetical protein